VFRIIGDIRDVQIIATGPGVRERMRLRKIYGPGRWRKLKGVALLELPDGLVARGEVHWYEAHGLGRKELKLKRLLRMQS
jgi:hypothetical protein